MHARVHFTFRQRRNISSLCDFIHRKVDFIRKTGVLTPVFLIFLPIFNRRFNILLFFKPLEKFAYFDDLRREVGDGDLRAV